MPVKTVITSTRPNAGTPFFAYPSNLLREIETTQGTISSNITNPDPLTEVWIVTWDSQFNAEQLYTTSSCWELLRQERDAYNTANGISVSVNFETE